MTKENLTEIICITDRSGSMNAVWTDTVGGLNDFIKKQREVPGEAKISLVFFDTEYEMPYNGIDLNSKTFDDKLSFADFAPRGWTALLDAIGKTINDVGSRLKKTPENERPSKVLVCIVTDGQENSSKEFTSSQIKQMIEHQTEKYQWDFIYLGANQDAFAVGGNLGIIAVNCANYANQNTRHAFAGLSMRSCSVRKGENIGSVASYYSSSLADAGLKDDLNPPSVLISSDADDNQ